MYNTKKELGNPIYIDTKKTSLIGHFLWDMRKPSKNVISQTMNYILGDIKMK